MNHTDDGVAGVNTVTLHDQTSSVLPNRPNLTVFSFIGVSPVISKQVGLVNWASLRSILCVLKVVRVIWCRKQGYQTRRWSGGGGYATDCFIASPPQRRVVSGVANCLC